MSFEQYKIIKNSIQLVEVGLFSLECKQYVGQDNQLKVQIGKRVELMETGKAAVYLEVSLSFEQEGPFFINLVYKGLCNSVVEISDEKLKEYADSIAVSLLLPYARECISNILARMNFPIYYLPTMDILMSISKNPSQE